MSHGNYGGSPDGYTLSLYDSANLVFGHYTSGSWDDVTSSANAINLNQWQLVTATYDSGSVVLYVDAVQVGSGDIGTFSYSSNDFSIGIDWPRTRCSKMVSGKWYTPIIFSIGCGSMPVAQAWPAVNSIVVS